MSEHNLLGFSPEVLKQTWSDALCPWEIQTEHSPMLSGTLTYLVNGVVAVFFVNEGIKNTEVIIHLPLPFYPPPV